MRHSVYGMHKRSDGFDMLDKFGMPVDTVIVGEQWKSKHDPYLITIKSFDPGKEYFQCDVTDQRTGATWPSSIQDAMHFYSNYEKIALASSNYKIVGRAISKEEVNALLDAVTHGPRCECGGHKAGFKDYTRQHSSWCPVYKE